MQTGSAPEAPTADPRRPERPASDSFDALGFRRRNGMVRWLSPTQLAATAVRVLLSSVFGAYADKREIQAALPCPDLAPYTGEKELWVDYVADLGDAFGPTYSIASLLARPELSVDLPGGGTAQTCRGRVLVMGGDQVYPTPSIADYRDHTIGPYRAALPYVDPDSAAPHLFAIPGNHDWYDGLTGFMRVFCRGEWIGGWKTRQQRSYFAVQLREDWWLWGIDIQFDSYIDEPQFDYFKKVAEKLEPGDSVILCSAVPSWVEANQPEHPEAFSTLDYFERKIIRERGAEVRLALSGDAHHYAHYARRDKTAHRLTAGGGGAFLSATHHLPESLELPPTASREVGKSKPPEVFELQTCYPTRKESRRLRWRVAALPFQNGSMAALIGGVHLLYAWMIQSVLRSGFSTPSGAKADEAPDFSRVMPAGSAKDLYRAVLRSPLAVVLTTLITWGMSGFTKSKKPAVRAAGALHGLLHVGLAVGTISKASDTLHRRGLRHTRFLAGFAVLVGAGGGLLGSWLLAAYLFVADRFLGCNTNELFASQRNRGCKNFLRIHFDGQGGVTVYPFEVARTPRRWRLRRDGTQDDPWFEPDGEDLTWGLIEEPIRVVPPRSGAP